MNARDFSDFLNLSFADRDFYYGDPYFPPEEPVTGLLSKKYAKQRLKQINWNKNDINAGPGDPYRFQKGNNPYLKRPFWPVRLRYRQLMRKAGSCQSRQAVAGCRPLWPVTAVSACHNGCKVLCLTLPKTLTMWLNRANARVSP